MRVRVRPLRRNGRLLKRDELRDVPPRVGLLRLRQTRDVELNRACYLAQLFDPTVTVETEILPSLSDAELISIEGNNLRLNGIERLKDADVMQTWVVEID